MTTIPSSKTNDISGDSKRASYVTREALLGLLSDEEVARVSTTEASPRLANDEEYIDLLQLSEGVRKVSASSVLTMGHVLARNSVGKETWTKICSRLTSTVE